MVATSNFVSANSPELQADIHNKKKFDYKSNLALGYSKPFLPKFNVRGIYVTGWVAGIPERMNELINLVDETVLNTMVIDVKDDLGYLSYSSNVKLAKDIGANRSKIKDIENLLSLLDQHGIHTIARIAVFKDALLASKKNDFALRIQEEKDEKFSEEIAEKVTEKMTNEKKSKDVDVKEKNSLETELDNNDENINEFNVEVNNILEKRNIISKSSTWVNPANKEVWEYNIQLAREALELGFDEVQFDYIRYPALRGRFSVFSEKNDNKDEIINNFVTTVYKELDDINKKVSIDVFGLTTTLSNGMGIGQNYEKLSKSAKIISPMVYPSHYSPGVFDLTMPEEKPYETVYKSMKDALGKSGNNIVLRPWLQDFTINYKYNVDEIVAQIKAVEELGINEWLLWNPTSRYTEEAIQSLNLVRNYYKRRYDLVPSY